MVACFRKLQGWSLNAAITEYVKYSEPKSRALDRKFITDFDEATLSSLAKEVGACNWTRQILPFGVMGDNDSLDNEDPARVEVLSEMTQLNRSFSL